MAATRRQKKVLIEAGGIRGLANSLRRIGDEELSKEMKKVTMEAAVLLAEQAKIEVPRGPTGDLKKTIKPMATRRYARVKAGTPSKVPYARSVHSGRYFETTGLRTRGNPYIRKSIPKKYPEIIDVFVEGMNRIAKEFEKKHGVARYTGAYKK
jgi:hypothetical protein